MRDSCETEKKHFLTISLSVEATETIGSGKLLTEIEKGKIKNRHLNKIGT